MKKTIGIIILSLVIIGSAISVVYAQNSHKHDSKGPEQVMDNFMIMLFHDEISNAVNNYYNKENVSFTYDWWNKDYDVVEMDQWEKGNELKAPFEVKFTVMPQTNKNLGTDAITLGIVPRNQNREMEVKLLNYEHKEPLKDNN